MRICGRPSRRFSWRHHNGAKWQSIPAELGPWWKAALTFIRWPKLGVSEQLLELAQHRGVALGMMFVDGSIRAHHKAAGAAKRGPTAKNATAVRRLTALVAVMAPRSA